MPIGRQDKHKHFRIKVSLFPFYFFNKSTEKTHETLAICEFIYYFCTEKPTNEEIIDVILNKNNVKEIKANFKSKCTNLYPCSRFRA